MTEFTEEGALMRSIRGIAMAALMVMVPAGAWAGIDKAGTTAAGFLSVGAGADVLGMGGTTLGFGGGLGAAAWNVAALGRLSGTQYVFSHASITGESPQDWIAAGGRFGTSRTRWGLSGLYQGDGAFEGRDVNNVSTGSFNASSMALGFQLAQPLGPVAMVGGGMKYVSEKLGDLTGGGVTFDAGLRVQAGAVGFGAAAQNVFGKMSYGGEKYDFPTSYGAGLAFPIPITGITLAMDANFPRAYYTDVRGGLEWRYRERVALRTGYRKEMGAGAGEPLGGPTFGMGAGANGFWIDYGFLTGGASGSGQHRMGLTYRPGFMNSEPEAEVVRAPRPASVEQTARVNPSYVERAKAVRSSTPETPKPAPAKSRAPQGVAPPVVAPVKTPKAVAPAASAPSLNTSDRDPARPAVAAPAPIKPTPAKPEAAKVEKPAVVRPVTPPLKTVPVERPVPPAAKVQEVPKPAPAPTKVDAPAPRAPRPVKVKVKSGQTLADIAKEWGNTVPALMMENNMVSEQVKPGQTLLLPAKGR
ncbi:MAG: LysM peptidoglycan-binding domain-containing protein [Candidatus Eisenbacteria bacterium]